MSLKIMFFLTSFLDRFWFHFGKVLGGLGFWVAWGDFGFVLELQGGPTSSLQIPSDSLIQDLEAHRSPGRLPGTILVSIGGEDGRILDPERLPGTILVSVWVDFRWVLVCFNGCDMLVFGLDFWLRIDTNIVFGNLCIASHARSLAHCRMHWLL